MPAEAKTKNAVQAELDDELVDAVIREIIAAERKIYFETPNSSTARTRAVRDIIDRRTGGTK